MVAYLIAAVIFLLYEVLVWFVGNWLHLQGSSLWALRSLLTLIGFVAVGTFLWFYRGSRTTVPADAGGAAGGEIDQRVREALGRLRAMTRDTRRNFGDQALMLLLGPAGSTKTSIVRNCGLDADLLSGQVEQDGAVVPTSSVNLFYTRQAVFVDVGAALLDAPGGVKRVLARLQPNSFSRAVSSAQSAPRSVIVCVDCESVQQGTQASGPAARKLNAVLQEIAQVLGTDFAVYVVFTKLDRVAGFTEYVRNLSKDEAGQVLGATLPLRRGGTGVYAEDETRRLTKHFDELFCSLAEKRPEVLARENDPSKFAPAYQFPRELRKLRAPLVQMLVDICRPTQMPNNPFLRGFYFCGVRPLVVEEVVSVAGDQGPAADAGRGATRMFSFADAAAAARSAPQRVTQTRKVPQWAFVTHLFTDVILRDRTAAAASGVSSNVSLIRRILLAGAAVLGLLLITAFTISFFANRSMQRTVAEAAQTMSAGSAAEVPSLADLQKLDAIRSTVDTLARYRREGAPWYMRWGLYSDDTYVEARRIYFAKFRAQLFGATRSRLLTALQGLPATPDPARDYASVYDTLKAYLITTANHDKSTREFLAPVLYDRYAAGREIDADREKLARAQFEFYSSELKGENPYTDAADGAAVEQGRKYLKNFADTERVYRNILSEASAKAPTVNFNRQFPGSADVLINNRDVPGAFSKAGYAYVQDAIKNLDRYLKGEEWVLGADVAAVSDVAKLRTDLSARYKSDFLANWRGFLRNSTFLQFRTLADASAKLAKLSAPTSPMLELMSTASRNTAVEDPALSASFQPVQTVVRPETPDQYIQPGNQAYVTAISNLQAAIALVQASPAGLNDANAVGQALAAATSGVTAVRQVAQNFRVDPEAHVEGVTQHLLEQPFDAAVTLLRGASAADVNGAAAGFCDAYDQLMRKFPMNPNAREEATLDEFNALFAPGKKFWQMYDAKLQKVMVQQGTQYVAANTGSLRITPEFQRFFNTVAEFSQSLYPAGSQQPRVTYTLTELPRNAVQGLSITIDGETLSGSGARKQFVWPGNAQGMKLNGAGLGVPLATFDGLWGVFQFMSRARWTTTGPGSYELEFPLQFAGQTSVTVRYGLESANAALFQRRLAATRCVRQAAR
jgi:type VI secretion system protein ImpL